MRVRYRRQAELDIENIYSNIELDNPRAAANVVARIRYASERLGILPYMGHDGLNFGTYEWVVVGLPYIIVYEVDEGADEVAIVAVLHGARLRKEQL